MGRYDLATEVERLRRSGGDGCGPNLLEAAREFLASRPYGSEVCLEADFVLTTYRRDRDPELLEQEFNRYTSPCYQIRLLSLRLDIREIAYFCSQALHWLELPLSQLGVTHFGGEYQWGYESDRLTMGFRPQPCYPNKADWLEVRFSFGNEGGHGEFSMELDRSCLEEFVQGWVAL